MTSIIDDVKSINQAMQSLQPRVAERNNGLYQCHRCFNYLGELPIGTIATCPSCNTRNRIKD